MAKDSRAPAEISIWAADVMVMAMERWFSSLCCAIICSCLGHTITKIIAEVLSDQASSSRQNVLAQTQTCPSSPGSAAVHFAIGRLVGQSSRQEEYFIIYITHLSHMWSQWYAVKVYECRWHPTTYNIPVTSWPYLPNYRSVNNYNESFFYAPFRTSPILNHLTEKCAKARL